MIGLPMRQEIASEAKGRGRSIEIQPNTRSYHIQEKLYMIPDGSDMRNLDYELLLKIPHEHWPQEQQVAREFLLGCFRFWGDPRLGLSERGSDPRTMERRSA